MQKLLTQNQLTELLETEGARTMLEKGEERGWIEPTELEAFAVEHELVDGDVEELTRELERATKHAADLRADADRLQARAARERALPQHQRHRK